MVTHTSNETIQPDTELVEHWRHVQMLQLAAAPQSPQEALEHIKEGLVRALEGAKLLVALPTFGDLRSEDWHTIRTLTEGLWEVVSRGDQPAVAALRAPIREWHKKWGGPPLAGAVERIQQTAAALAATLERAKQVGIGTALLERDGRPAAPGNAPSRDQVSRYLAIELSKIDNVLPQPILPAPLTIDAACERIYASMPLGGHGAQVDRSGAFRGEPFQADSEKTVIAAFKAVGIPAEKADNLFKASLKRKNKNTKRRLRQGRVR